MMHFVRTFSVVRARRNAIKEVRNCGKIVYIKSIFENGWWEDAYSSFYPPGSGRSEGPRAVACILQERHCPAHKIVSLLQTTKNKI